MAGGSSRDADQVPQLVERAESLGASRGDRSGRVPCFVDGEFSLDAAGKRRDAVGTKTGDRAGSDSPARSKSLARPSERWELGRRLPTRRRRDAENLEGRPGGDERVAQRRLGRVIRLALIDLPPNAAKLGYEHIEYVCSTVPLFRRPLRRGDRVLSQNPGCRGREAGAVQGCAGAAAGITGMLR